MFQISVQVGALDDVYNAIIQALVQTAPEICR